MPAFVPLLSGRRLLSSVREQAVQLVPIDPNRSGAPKGTIEVILCSRPGLSLHSSQSDCDAHTDRGCVLQVHYAELAALRELNPAINITHPNCRQRRTPRFLSGRPVVVLASRAGAAARAVLNEQELVDYVVATYDVDLQVVTEDSNSTWQMVDLVRVRCPASCSSASFAHESLLSLSSAGHGAN